MKRWVCKIILTVAVAAIVLSGCSGGVTPILLGEGRIVFASDRDTGPGSGEWEIYTMKLDGTDVRRLTNSPNKDLEPAWSFDRRKIVYISGRSGTSGLFVMDADGSSQRQVSNNAIVNSARTPAWSPNGRQIVFAAGLSGDAGLYVVNADGTGLTQITTEGRNPSWGINNKIVFDGFPAAVRTVTRGEKSIAKPRLIPSNGRKLWVINPDGTGLTQLPITESKEPEWSPDCRKIVCKDVRRDTLVVMDKDGNNQQLLGVGGAYPSFSADGLKIVLVAQPGGVLPELLIVNADGTGLTQLTNNTAFDLDPNWK